MAALVENKNQFGSMIQALILSSALHAALFLGLTFAQPNFQFIDQSQPIEFSAFKSPVKPHLKPQTLTRGRSSKQAEPVKAESIEQQQSTSTEKSSASATVVPANATLVTEGLKLLNLNEVNKLLRRTPEAMKNNIEGKIRFKLLVDEFGRVRSVEPENKLGYGLDEVAITAAWKLLFKPARVGTKAVPLETLYTVRFNLEHL